MSSKRLLPPDHTGAAELPSDLPTLTIRAVQLCESYSRRGAVVSNGDIERTLHHLKSSRLRSQQSAGVFRENGGIEALLNISGKLQPGVDSDCKTLTIVWGTLANLCALEEQCRDKARDYMYLHEGTYVHVHTLVSFPDLYVGPGTHSLHVCMCWINE